MTRGADDRNGGACDGKISAHGGNEAAQVTCIDVHVKMMAIQMT